MRPLSAREKEEEKNTRITRAAINENLITMNHAENQSVLLLHLQIALERDLIASRNRPVLPSRTG
jgi:hypothetical protein